MKKIIKKAIGGILMIVSISPILLINDINQFLAFIAGCIIGFIGLVGLYLFID